MTRRDVVDDAVDGNDMWGAGSTLIFDWKVARVVVFLIDFEDGSMVKGRWCEISLLYLFNIAFYLFWLILGVFYVVYHPDEEAEKPPCSGWFFCKDHSPAATVRVVYN